MRRRRRRRRRRRNCCLWVLQLQFLAKYPSFL